MQVKDGNGATVEIPVPTGPGATEAEQRAVQGVAPVVVGVDGAALRGLMAVCTVAGNATVKFADDSTAVVPVGVGLTLWPFAAKGVTVSTATATYYRTK